MGRVILPGFDQVFLRILRRRGLRRIGALLSSCRCYGSTSKPGGRDGGASVRWLRSRPFNPGMWERSSAGNVAANASSKLRPRYVAASSATNSPCPESRLRLIGCREGLTESQSLWRAKILGSGTIKRRGKPSSPMTICSMRGESTSQFSPVHLLRAPLASPRRVSVGASDDLIAEPLPGLRETRTSRRQLTDCPHLSRASVGGTSKASYEALRNAPQNVRFGRVKEG